MSRDIGAYLQTKVSHYKTQEAIVQMLERRGITEIRLTSLSDKILLEFNYPQKIDGKPFKLGVRFDMPIPASKDDKERTKVRNQRYRAMFYILKSKLEAVEFGLREFGQEFLGDLIYRLPDGRTVTVIEIIGPQLQKNLREGKSEVLMLEQGG